MNTRATSLAAALLLLSSGIALAQTPMGQQQRPATTGQGSTQMDPNRGTGMTGAPSSTNPQAAGGYNQPRQLPENGGSPTTQIPNTRR
jgi:hypothetical protein